MDIYDVDALTFTSLPLRLSNPQSGIVELRAVDTDGQIIALLPAQKGYQVGKIDPSTGLVQGVLALPALSLNAAGHFYAADGARLCFVHCSHPLPPLLAPFPIVIHH